MTPRSVKYSPDCTFPTQARGGGGRTGQITSGDVAITSQVQDVVTTVMEKQELVQGQAGNQKQKEEQEQEGAWKQEQELKLKLPGEQNLTLELHHEKEQALKMEQFEDQELEDEEMQKQEKNYKQGHDKDLAKKQKIQQVQEHKDPNQEEYEKLKEPKLTMSEPSELQGEQRQPTFGGASVKVLSWACAYIGLIMHLFVLKL